MRDLSRVVLIDVPLEGAKTDQIKKALLNYPLEFPQEIKVRQEKVTGSFITHIYPIEQQRLIDILPGASNVVASPKWVSFTYNKYKYQLHFSPPENDPHHP
jgi:hypothetical protein